MRSRAHERGQTTIDFVTGMSVFLLVLIGVLVFLSGAFEPVGAAAQDTRPTADRVAGSLSTGLLGDPATPYLLGTSCTVDFFEGTSPADCRYTGSTVQERVGLDSTTSVNIKLRELTDSHTDGDLLCWDADAEEVTTTGCDTTFEVGADPPGDSTATVTAERIVRIDGTDAALIVELW